MNIYSGLLFLHGHVADARLARQLVDAGDAEDAARTTGPRERGQAVEEGRPGAAGNCHAGRGTTSGLRG